MKTLLISAVAASLWLVPGAARACGSCDHHQHDHAAASPSASTRALGPDEARVTIPVTGMHCDHCAARVESALGQVNGVKLAEANHHGAQAVVIVEKAKLDTRKLVDAINALGFKAGSPALN